MLVDAGEIVSIITNITGIGNSILFFSKTFLDYYRRGQTKEHPGLWRASKIGNLRKYFLPGC
jgi:hypothetical protein